MPLPGSGPPPGGKLEITIPRSRRGEESDAASAEDTKIPLAGRRPQAAKISFCRSLAVAEFRFGTVRRLGPRAVAAAGTFERPASLFKLESGALRA